jgi:hypothetical protein
MKTIKMITKEYGRTDSGKSWKSKPHTIEEKEIDMQKYKNITSDDTCRFFRRLGGSETVNRTYTSIGYVPYELISCNPDRSVRKVRRFIID